MRATRLILCNAAPIIEIYICHTDYSSFYTDYKFITSHYKFYIKSQLPSYSLTSVNKVESGNLVSFARYPYL